VVASEAEDWVASVGTATASSEAVVRGTVEAAGGMGAVVVAREAGLPEKATEEVLEVGVRELSLKM
jgi:hypothetical protein